MLSEVEPLSEQFVAQFVAGSGVPRQDLEIGVLPTIQGGFA